MTLKLSLLGWLTAGLCVCFVLAVQGTDVRSWALALTFSLISFRKGAFEPSSRVPWKTEVLVTSIIAMIAAAALLFIDGVAQPKLSAALVLALFAASTAARSAARQTDAFGSDLRTPRGTH